MTHEAALAVERVTPPDSGIAAIMAFVAKQTGYFDSSTATESRLDMYLRLAKLAEEIVGLNAEDVLKNLVFEPVQIGSSEGHNVGNAVSTISNADVTWKKPMNVLPPSSDSQGFREDSKQYSSKFVNLFFESKFECSV